MALPPGEIVAAFSSDFWERDMARRLALTKPEDTVRGMFFRSLLDTIRELGGEALAARCRVACEHEKFVDLFCYPVRLHLRAVCVALGPLAEKLGGGAQALRLLGRRALEDFLGSHTGRMLWMVSGGDPKRLLNNAPTGYRVSASYGVHEVRWMALTRARWTMTYDYMPPPFHEGVFTAVLEKTHARNVRVVGRQTGALGGEYDISWE